MSQINPTIFIKRIVLSNYKELHHISENKGISFSLFMKQSLTQIAETYNQNLKEKKTEIEIKEVLRAYGVSNKTFDTLKIICENLNCDLSTFLKIELKKIADTYPDKMKQSPLDY